MNEFAVPVLSKKKLKKIKAVQEGVHHLEPDHVILMVVALGLVLLDQLSQ